MMKITKTIRNLVHIFCLVLIAFVQNVSWSQPTERTIEEIKLEAQSRADRGAYPMGGLDSQDVARALSLIKTRDRDDWAQGWSSVAQEYMQKAIQTSDPAISSQFYKRAWRLYYMAQWPVPNSEGKLQAYSNALKAYVLYAQSLRPQLSVVKIPFEGGYITGYLRLPVSSNPVPLILAISGLDSRKETVAESYSQILKHGVGFLALDGPGTGQAPIKVSQSAERMFSAVLDYLQTLPEVDHSRIIVSGVSFGGYWSSKLAVTQRARLLGSVSQSPPVDEFFSTKFLLQNTLGNKEYLFDLAPAFVNVFEGASSVEDLQRLMPAMSLKAQGLLSKPTPPMLIVAGAKDTQVPLSDIELLMRSGDSPRELWLNPTGGHLGRDKGGWTDPVIFSKVIIPWELRLIEQSR
jgi:esterase/lipase